MTFIALGFLRPTVQQRRSLTRKGLDQSAASARHSLVGSHIYAVDTGGIMNRFQCNQHLNRRTIRVRDNVTYTIVGNGLRIHLGHDQRNIRLITKMRSVIDDDTTCSTGTRSVIGRNTTAGREQADIHTGEIELRGPNVAGIGVHIGARVAALAGPGEVLVSRTVKDLVNGSDLEFVDRGTHQLKGIEDAWLAVVDSIPMSVDWFPAGVPSLLAQLDGGEGTTDDSGLTVDSDRLLVRVVGYGGTP